MQCPRCQHENPAGQKFCGGCGTRLASVCPSCSASNPPGQKFCGECGTALGQAGGPGKYGTPDSYTPKHLAEKILTSKAALEGERKQVTVLFADLKGSMELLADRDPEEARKLLDPVLEHMMEAVHRYEGTVNQVMGDGIMALFGAPLAHEDHAIRACYAALLMQESIRRYADEVFRSRGVPVRIRVGLNSGEVVVRAIGSDLHMDYTAVGQTTHLAARMEQLADPGTILLTPATRQLVEGYVEVVGRGPVPVKGLAAPVEVYELVGAGPIRSRLQAAAAHGLTRFVGRDPEMEQLRLALERAGAGRGQVVGVVGEPGVGKSRLYWEFIHSPLTDGWLVLEGRSVSYGKATSYLPVIDLLKGYFQIEVQDEPGPMRLKVSDRLLSLDEALRPALPAFLALLDLPVEDPTWQALDPPQRRQRTVDGVKRLLLRESRVQPVLLVFEDLHWIDSETQALLDSLVETLATARLLLLVNYRPEYQPPWAGKTYYAQLRTDPLSLAGAEQLLHALIGADGSLEPLIHLLIERTDGNPFFLEESVRDLVESGALGGQRGAYRLVRAAETLRIPATAQSILAARIDRLTPGDKRLLQTASVIGKDVPIQLLQAVAEMDEPAVRAGLARLQATEFLYEVQLFPEAEYTFKHALTHEAAYETLLHDRRCALHARLVDAIEQVYRGRLDEQVDRLAQHAQRGEVWGKAVTYAQQAGARAVARSAYSTAAALFEAALAAVPHLQQRRETQALSVDLMLALRGICVALGEPVRSLSVARRALPVAEALGDGERLTRAIAHLVNARYIAGDAAGAVALHDRLLALTEVQGLRAQQVEARTYLAQGWHALGAYRRAIMLLERNRNDDPGSNPTTDAIPSARTWPASRPSTSVLSDAYLAWSLAEGGEFREALEVAQEGTLLAQALDTVTVYSRLCALFGISMPAILRGEFATAIPWFEEGLAIARDAKMFGWLPAFTGLLGYAYGRIGRFEIGLRLLGEAMRHAEAKAPCHRARYLSNQSEILLLVGHADEARTAAMSGLEGARARGEWGDAARCLLALGEAEAEAGPPDGEAASTHLRDAHTLATDLGMRPLVAHCHLGFGKIYRRTGNRDQAYKHLTAALTMYRDMGMTYWQEQAERDVANSA